MKSFKKITRLSKSWKKYANVEKEELKAKKEEVRIVKEYLDAIKDLEYFLKPLQVKLSKKEEEKSMVFEKDTAFYDDFDEVYSDLQNTIVPLYNQTRNYLTKKPFSTEKYKLNFENQTLAAGWDKNKETDNTTVLFCKGKNYYLGVINKKHNQLFRDAPKAQTNDTYQKLIYKLLPGASKMLPKVFFSKSNIDHYNPSARVREIRNHASHTKNGTPQTNFDKRDFNLDGCHTMIDFFKQSIERHPEWHTAFGFVFSPTKTYQDMSGFYREVEEQGYKLSFESLDTSFINGCIEEGKLFLFQIYNKDFSSHSKGKPNLHTLYWKALFDERNLKDTVCKLNGEAELFYRPASIKYSDEIWEKGHHANDPDKKQNYPIIKDRRYAQDTFFFHVPITLNFKATGVTTFNDKINNLLKGNPHVTILSIDRGERHLAYYTLINQQGKIVKQGSFNNPQGKKDYHQLLDQREKERDEARKSWGAIEKIKDLKEGYLSQVVHEICNMVIEHNAIVVLEDLNFGFKKGRFKIEKQVYQKLEKMLIDKLNYLVFKDNAFDETGGVGKAYQLSAPFESFKKMGKQTGIIYYVPAYHTSKICPATGFVNLLYPYYETVKKSKAFFNKFDTIRYNKGDNYFEFHIENYTDFNAKAEGCKQQWVICSYGARLENFRDKEQNNNWTTRDVCPTKIIKEVLDDNNIDYTDGHCIKDKIVQQSEKAFFKGMIRGLKLTLQMRNSKIGEEEDWMISPIKKDENGQFFDSRNVKNKTMPENADANGAYHIGLKGLWVLQQLKEWQEGKKLNLAIKNDEWYAFVQNKAYRNRK